MKERDRNELVDSLRRNQSGRAELKSYERIETKQDIYLWTVAAEIAVSVCQCRNAYSAQHPRTAHRQTRFHARPSIPRHRR